MSTHTPGPYVVIDDLSTMDAIGIYADKGGTLVAELRDPEDAEDAKQMQANAAYIVRACNAHEEMLKALKAILDSGRYDDAGNFVIDCEPWDGQGDPPDTTDPLCIQSAWALIEAENKAEGRA